MELSTTAIDAIIDHAAGEPDVEDLRQKGNRRPAMPVEHQGPVQVQLLPTQDASVITRVLDAMPGGAAVSVIGKDLRRSKLTVISTVGAFRFGFDSSAIVGVWPANVPLVVSAAVEVWLTSDTVAATVTVFAEFWTN